MAVKEKIFVSFSKKQIFNRRNITKDGKQMTLLSIQFPKSSKFSDYYIDMNQSFVYPSHFSNNMACITFFKEQKITIRRYDKVKKEQEQETLSAEQVQKEFNSWKSKTASDDKKEEKDLSDVENNENYENIEI